VLPISTIIRDKCYLTRSIKLKYFFKNEPEIAFDQRKRFVEKSTWTPADDRVPEAALNIVDKIDECFKYTLANYRIIKKDDQEFIKLNEKPNLSKAEITSLKTLSKMSNIIIKPADKGGATVIMDRDNYVFEANKQLSDQNYYSKLPGPINMTNVPKIHKILEGIKKQGLISKKEFNYLSGPEKFKERTFYLLPKIHKNPTTWTIPHKMPPGRPIVSDVNSESYRISQYIDHFLNPLASKHPSYIKNTYEFINKIGNKNITRSHLLVTGDVTSLYTNMNINRTLDCVKKILSESPGDPLRPDKELIELLEITMKNNDFAFNGEYFLQTCGTAMGKIYAPSLANIYLLDFDHLAQTGFRIRPELFSRYLDDIFFLWGGTKTELKEFETYLNSLIPGITITLECSETEINFLDTTIYRKIQGDNVTDILRTKTYFKPTDTHQLLHKTSHHPKHTTAGILKSQLIRFKRISSTKEDYDTSCKILFQSLKIRGYSWSKMREEQKNIWFNYVEKNTQNQAPPKQILPIINENNGVGIKLTKGYKQIIESEDYLKKYKLIAAYRNPKNLHQHLVRAKLPTDETFNREGTQQINAQNMNDTSKNKGRIGFFNCQSPKCYACKIHTQSNTTFFSNTYKRKYIIKQSLTCNSRNIVYLLTCEICRIQYIGETNRTLAERLTDHRSNIKTNKKTPIAIHFNSNYHSINNVQAIAIEQIADGDMAHITRRKRETFWQNKLGTKHPQGLNGMPIPQ
jgi:hypothetical protein